MITRKVVFDSGDEATYLVKWYFLGILIAKIELVRPNHIFN